MFVRTTGCNLRCGFCDTPYTSWQHEGGRQDWTRVLEAAAEFGCEHVVLTGGEPLLQPEIVPLSRALRAAGLVVTIETAGTVDRPVEADLMSISPKLSNSVPVDHPRWAARHRRDQHRPDVVKRLLRDYAYQLKFVIDTPADLDELAAYLREFPEVDPPHVWLMPQGVHREELARRAEWLEPAARRLGYTFCPRRHIELYGNARGT